jgi:hypothetical protein
LLRNSLPYIPTAKAGGFTAGFGNLQSGLLDNFREEINKPNRDSHNDLRLHLKGFDIHSLFAKGRGRFESARFCIEEPRRISMINLIYIAENTTYSPHTNFPW